MGLIRKSLSISSAGMIDFRSDKERVARSARLTKKAIKSQTKQAAAIGAQQAKLLEQQLAMQVVSHQTAAAVAPTVPAAGPPPGFYNDPNGQPVQRWWDGGRWTDVTKQLGAE